MSETKGSVEAKIAMMRAAYEAWPDLDAYLREFRDDAVWHSPFAGDVSGKQAIRADTTTGSPVGARQLPCGDLAADVVLCVFGA